MSGYGRFLNQLLAAKSQKTALPPAPEALKMLADALNQPAPPETTAIRESYLQEAAKFVGREAEMAQLTEALAKAHDGSALVWLVGGESGVSESRLVDEFRTHALVSGWQVFIRPICGRAVCLTRFGKTLFRVSL
ncbi:MAG: ATP-binding protein [Chloroflexota bacterium]